jgi:prophage antirepressor-like protein
MTALDVFTYTGQQVNIVLIDNEPWFVANDIAAVLDLGNVRSSLALLDDDERGVHTVDTLGGQQSLTIVSEAGLYSLILRSRKPEAKAFKRWITHDVLPAIRKTGSYSAPVAEITRRDMALAVLAAEDEADRQRARAEVAESFKEAIEVNDGLTPREFHKQYLSDISEREFFEFLYSRKLLIDQRNQRVDAHGRPKPGRQHSHPSYLGKEFFYLFPTLDRDGIRREKTRVRPGEPELALLSYCNQFMLRAVSV